MENAVLAGPPRVLVVVGADFRWLRTVGGPWANRVADQTDQLRWQRIAEELDAEVHHVVHHRKVGLVAVVVPQLIGVGGRHLVQVVGVRLDAGNPGTGVVLLRELVVAVLQVERVVLCVGDREDVVAPLGSKMSTRSPLLKPHKSRSSSPQPGCWCTFSSADGVGMSSRIVVCAAHIRTWGHRRSPRPGSRRS